MKVELSSRSLIATLFRQRYIFVGVFALIIAAVYYYLSTTVPMYMSHGSIFVKFGSAIPDVQLSENRRTEGGNGDDRREMIQSYVEILRSGNLLRSIINDLGVDRVYPGLSDEVEGSDDPMDATLKRLLKGGDLNITTPNQSNIIEIWVLNHDPELAAQFVAELQKRFIAQESQISSKSKTDFLHDQLAKMKQELEASQKEFQHFKEVNGISTIDEELEHLSRQKVEDVRILSQGVEDAQAKLDELEGERAELLATYRMNSPQLVGVNAQISKAMQQLAMKKADLNAVAGKGNSSISARIKKLESLRSAYANHEQEVKINEDNYKNLLLLTEEAKVNDVLNERNITRFSIVDEPTPAMRPIKPRIMVIWAAGIVFAFIMGLGFALLNEAMDDKITAPEHITSVLKTPLLATFDA